MFTGLVLGTGSLRSLERRGPGFQLVIATPGLAGFDELTLGESIAVNGACLTVVAKGAASFDADVSSETVEKTTLGRLPLGTALNLERALRLGDRLGGHMMSGHVDCVGRVQSITEQGEGWLVVVAFPPEQARYIAAKGSIAIDGVSLTVNAVSESELKVMLIPHTRAMTSFKHLRAGVEVNLEVDLVARHLVRYFEVTERRPSLPTDSTLDLALERAGYK